MGIGTVLVLVLVPLAVIAVTTLLTVLPSLSRTPRYRPGQPWEHEPVWWTADPDGGTAVSGERDERAVQAAGGARGTW